MASSDGQIFAPIKKSNMEMFDNSTNNNNRPIPFDRDFGKEKNNKLENS
jgi:hypothetical protein